MLKGLRLNSEFFVLLPVCTELTPVALPAVPDDSEQAAHGHISAVPHDGEYFGHSDAGIPCGGKGLGHPLIDIPECLYGIMC